MKSNRQALLTLCLLLVLPTLSFAQQIDIRGRVALIIAALVNCDHYSAPQTKIRIAKILFEGSSQTQ